MTRYLIVGCSAGGIGAVEAIRGIDSQGEITVVSREAYPAYSRPMISEYLAGKATIEEMYYRKPSFYKEHNIDLRLDMPVTVVDAKERWAELRNGERLEWDRLLLATGALPVKPPLEGSDKQGVFSFTTIAEVQAVDEAIRQGAKTVAVMGGGLIGVSVADALIERGLRVVMVERLDRVLAMSLDSVGSDLITQAMRKAGVEIITSHGVAAITGQPSASDRVGGVFLDDGRHISADMVIVAVGVKANAELARDAGLEVERGIIVDHHMATSAPDVYACGDVTEGPALDGVRRMIALWPLAYMGGRIAGMNMAGREADYAGGVSLTTMKYFGTRMVSAGVLEGEGENTETLVSHTPKNYRKVVVRDNKVIGLVFSGEIERSGLVFSLMREGVDVGDFKDSLVADSFGLVALPSGLRHKMLRPSRQEANDDNEGIISS